MKTVYPFWRAARGDQNHGEARPRRLLGPVLWRPQPTYRRETEPLAGPPARLPLGRHCFKFRHESWFAPDVCALLRAHNAALVIGDHPKRPFQPHKLTADWTFVRFHYGA